MKWAAFIVCFVLYSHTHAQHFDWSKSYGSSIRDDGHRVVVDDSLNSYMVGTCGSSIQFDSISFQANGGRISNLFLLKKNTNGNLLYLSIIEGNDIQVKTVYYNRNNHTILVGGETTDSLFVNNVYLTSASPLGKSNSFISVFDARTGNHLWTRIANSSSNMGSPNVVSDDSGYCYLISAYHIEAQISGQYTYITSAASVSIFVAKFDALGNFIWQKNLVDNLGIINNIDFKNNKFYLIGNIAATVYAGNKVLNPIPSNSSNALIIIADTSGQVLDGFTAATHASALGWCIKSFNNSIYIAGNYFAGNYTPTFGNKVINNNNNGIYVAKYSENGNCFWVKSSYNFSGFGYGQAFDLNYNKSGNIYITGKQNNLKFNNTIPSHLSIFISKFDSLGNYLWTFFAGANNGLVQGWSVSVDTLKNAYVCGTYISTIQLGSDTFTSNNNSYDIFLTKIQDVTITRSQAMPKKYCSGDSVFVPYSISGQFTPGNHFIAQLSDRYGSFDSVFYTLGLDSSTQGGIINGKIPDTLITSTNYSIRVIADNPAVVSFADSITFSISQKPVAKAGRDTLICFGQTLHLGDSNSSATQYLWKPSIFMNDSTAKFPLVKPDTSITYILTATNNCSVFDTVVVNVRKPLWFAPLHDTVFCKNDTLLLQPALIGGNISQQKLNVFKLPDTLSFAVNDSLMRVHFIPDTSRIYRVVLSDGCSIPFSDTFNLKLRVPLNLATSNDTLVCRGLPLLLSVNGWQSDSAAYQFNWSYKKSSLTDSSFINLISDSSMMFLLKSKYVCVNKVDSHFVNVKVLPRLQLKLTTDTSMCFGNSYSVTAKASGGDTLHYKFNWKNLLDSTTFVDSNYSKTFSVSHLFKPLQTVTYQLKLTDGCTVPIDSSQIKITVYQKIVAGFTVDDSVQCIIGNNFLFTDTSFIASGTYNRFWNLGDATTNTISSFNKSYTATGTYQIQLKIVEPSNCSDSATHTVVVKQNPVKPQILSVTNTQIQSTFSANNYTWFLNNGAIVNSNLQAIYIHQNGKYFVKVDSTNGCSNSSDPINITLYNGSQVLIYPNPNNGNFTINFIEIPGIKNVDIYDMAGKFLSSFSTSEDLININFQQLFSSGMYLLKIQTDEGIFVEKIVVE